MNVYIRRGFLIAALGLIISGIFYSIGAHHLIGVTVGAIFAAVAIYQVQLGRTKKGEESTRELKAQSVNIKKEIIKEGKIDTANILSEMKKSSRALQKAVEMSNFPDFEKRLQAETGHSIAELKKLALATIERANSYMDIGNSYIILDKYELAIDNYTNAISQVSEEKASNGYFNRAMAKTYILHGMKFSEKKDRSSDFYHLQLKNLDKDSYVDIIQDFTKSIDLKPSGIAYNNRGMLHLDFEKDLEAERDFKDAIELNEKASLYYSNHGTAATYLAQKHKSSGDEKSAKKYFSEAEISFNKAIKLASSNAVYHNNRGYFFYIQKKFDLAIDDLSEAIKIDSNYARPYYHRGIIYGENIADFPNSIKDLTKAIDLKIELNEAYRHRGFSYFYNKNYEKAIKDFTAFLLVETDSWVILFYRALCYKKLKQSDDFNMDFAKALEINPNLQEWIKTNRKD